MPYAMTRHQLDPEDRRQIQAWVDPRLIHLDSDVLAMWIALADGNILVTPMGLHTLGIACQSGGYVVSGSFDYGEFRARIAVATLRALVRRGFLRPGRETNTRIYWLSQRALDRLDGVV